MWYVLTGHTLYLTLESPQDLSLFVSLEAMRCVVGRSEGDQRFSESHWYQKSLKGRHIRREWLPWAREGGLPLLTERLSVQVTPVQSPEY